MKRKFGAHDFQHVGEIEPRRDARGAVVKHRPGVGQSEHLHKYGQGPFCQFRIAQGWRFSGVYVIESKDLVCYVGQCHDLSGVWSSIGSISPAAVRRTGGQQTHCMNNNLIFSEVAQGRNVNLWFYAIEDNEMRETVKSELMQRCIPLWNIRR